ncbi:MAG: hypothetical protein KDN22_33870 [Verrucomicrobiae bacterium]|nr:hypothetical protein [Verrucomicrobiae bacterium]
MKEIEMEGDVPTLLVLRYLDGSAGSDEVALLNEMLLRSRELRVWFLEIAQQSTVLSDFYRVENAAVAMAEGAMADIGVDVPEWDRESWECVSEERRAHSDRRRTLFVAAASAAAAMVAITGFILVWATEPSSASAVVGPLPTLAIPFEAQQFFDGTIEPVELTEIDIAEIDADLLQLSPISPLDEIVPEPEPASPKGHFLSRCNSLTFWSVCRLAAQSDIQQAIFSSALFMGFVQLEFSSEPFTFPRRESAEDGEVSEDWMNPRTPLELMAVSKQIGN